MDKINVFVLKRIFPFIFRTTGSGNPGSKSPAGGTSGEPRTPVAGPQNKQLQNVKGDHPSVSSN